MLSGILTVFYPLSDEFAEMFSFYEKNLEADKIVGSIESGASNELII
jgi:hypothetical protein